MRALDASHRSKEEGWDAKKVMGRAGTTNSGKMLHGSRFEVLMEEVDHIDDGRNQASTSNKLQTDNNLNSESLLYIQSDRRVPSNTEPQQCSKASAHVQNVEVLSSSEGIQGSDSMRGETDLVGGQADPGRVASAGRVVTAKSTLNAAKNVEVQVFEPGMALGSHASKGRSLPSSLKSRLSKSNLKPSGINQVIKQLGTKQKKRDDRGVGKQSLASGLSKLVEDLNNAETSVASKLGSTSSDVEGGDKRVHWIPNSTFEQHGDSERQGALDPTLIRSFKLLVKKQAGFDSSYRVEARGFSGGIWVLWNDSVMLDILAVSNQYIHGFYSLVGENRSFFLTCVYASPNPLKRRILWNQLKALEPASGAPWVIGGDLNVIASLFERQGGSHYRSNICRDLGDFMMDTGLLDMGFNGPKFTWKRGTLSQQLDRCICNSAWYELFPSSEVFHLIKLGSDHRPILLDIGSSITSSGYRPFRYIVAWNDHPGFNDFLKEAWSETGDVAMNMASFRDKVRKWNLEVFGHIGRRKNMLLARIKGVEHALELSSNPFLESLEVDLKQELNLVLEQEESLWFQRARSQWVEKGDRNTTFFHTAATIRRKRNTNRMLRLEDGRWCDDHDRLKLHAIGFFQNLFTSDHVQSHIWDLTSSFFQFSASDLRPLIASVSVEEIREVVFSMAPLKAPGVDGLHVAFFQKNWEVVRDSVCRTLLVLIPKVEKPDSITQFRPIGLCNVLYKFITKILVNRLKPFLPNWVSDTQVSFVPGRHITDNIIIAQEVMHSMSIKKGRNSWMAIKVDLEKAYDRLEWDYIEETLYAIGRHITDNIIIAHEVMHSMSIKKGRNSWMAIKVDLEKAYDRLEWDYIEETLYAIGRHITDNIIIAHEVMHSMSIKKGRNSWMAIKVDLEKACDRLEWDYIEETLYAIGYLRLSIKVDVGSWKAIHLGRSGPSLSHLFFVDDMVLFAEASLDQVLIIRDVMDRFCVASGHKISAAKTQICFSNNCTPCVRATIANGLGFEVVSDLGKYLGVPLLHKRVSKDTYAYLLDKMKARLPGWAANTLTLAGRITLAKAVLQAIPSYVIQSSWLLLSCSINGIGQEGVNWQ
ncbi:hypothetical protein GQ457_14G017730 [Hibiscus cannabinus]